MPISHRALNEGQKQMLAYGGARIWEKYGLSRAYVDPEVMGVRFGRRPVDPCPRAAVFPPEQADQIRCGSYYIDAKDSTVHAERTPHAVAMCAVLTSWFCDVMDVYERRGDVEAASELILNDEVEALMGRIAMARLQARVQGFPTLDEALDRAECVPEAVSRRAAERFPELDGRVVGAVARSYAERNLTRAMRCQLELIAP